MVSRTIQVPRRFLASLNENRRIILDLVQRAAYLAERLQGQPPPLVLCHSDTHAWNLLIDRRGKVYIVDSDNPILAPKERDLMFIGGAWALPGIR